MSLPNRVPCLRRGMFYLLIFPPFINLQACLYHDVCFLHYKLLLQEMMNDVALPELLKYLLKAAITPMQTKTVFSRYEKHDFLT